MNSEERKAQAKRHMAISDYWQSKIGPLATRADRIGNKISKLAKEPMGEQRRARLMRAPHKAVAHLLAEIARCEHVSGRHAAAVAKLGFNPDNDTLLTP